MLVKQNSAAKDRKMSQKTEVMRQLEIEQASRMCLDMTVCSLNNRAE